jgi:transposase InsO family protein
MSLLCRRFSIARKTGYKWLARFRQKGESGLLDQSRRPLTFHEPTSPRMEGLILKVRHAHPAWGGRKIRARLEQLNHEGIPSASTITAILHRHGLISEKGSLDRGPMQRFEREHPNELWQMDFKGEFRLSNGQWCHPLTILDDHSRFSLLLSACGNEQRLTVQSELIKAFRRYGLPRKMLMDNGPPWGVPNALGSPTMLSVWLMDLDVNVCHGRPYHPQTQGKEERFHRTLKQEVLQGRTFETLKETQNNFDRWREVYNHERPHEALELKPPVSRYQVSSRAYPEQLTPFEYDESFAVRRVCDNGRMVFRGKVYRVNRGFAHRQVGVRATDQDGIWAVYYRSFKIDQLDEALGKPHH